ncbi:MAG: hypothetical protein QM756_15620 [Polyangiaceae bacterium]
MAPRSNTAEISELTKWSLAFCTPSNAGVSSFSGAPLHSAAASPASPSLSLNTCVKPPPCVLMSQYKRRAGTPASG